MAITFMPSKFAKKLVPKKTVEKLVSRNLTVNRAAVTMLTKSGVLSKKKVEEVAIRVIRQYKEKFSDEIDDGATRAEALNEAVNDKVLLVQRVQNVATHEVAKEVKKSYRGERYEWLPSLAENPDPLHQLNYGKRFWLGRGEAPGDRYGCQCGMRILVDETQLFLDDEISA